MYKNWGYKYQGGKNGFPCRTFILVERENNKLYFDGYKCNLKKQTGRRARILGKEER